MNNVTLPVQIQTRLIEREGKTIYYPEVYGLVNKSIQQKINWDILHLTEQLIKYQHTEQGFDHFDEIIGTYEIKTNERNILSISLTNYAISSHAAHGLTIIKSLTFNISTGKVYELANLFKSQSNYIQVLTKLIKQQIKQRDIPLINDFSSIRPDQDFYLADKSLVIYFQLYEITPYYIGLPMFPISVFELNDIYKETGPLGILATNS